MLRALQRIFVALCVAMLAGALLVGEADARAGGGFSSGSRGMRTFNVPSATPTAPSGGSLFQRSVTQPSTPGVARPATTGGFFNRPGGLFGGGLWGGLAAGFLGAGLFGLLFGHGFFGGLGGFASLLGLLIQVALVVIVARLIWAWWQRRNEPAFAGGPSLRNTSTLRDLGLGAGSSGVAGGAAQTAGGKDQVGVKPEDYDTFERLLGEIQAAYSAEDLAALRAWVTPEMLSYFADDLAHNASRGVVNHVSDVKLLQGDLAEAWREGDVDYATVAMRFSLVDRTVERASGRLVEGSDQPQEVAEIWTFMRVRGGTWILAAIQQTQ